MKNVLCLLVFCSVSTVAVVHAEESYKWEYTDHTGSGTLTGIDNRGFKLSDGTDIKWSYHGTIVNGQWEDAIRRHGAHGGTVNVKYRNWYKVYESGKKVFFGSQVKGVS
ncbi:MAG: hypothetical protein QNK37_00335 [Acidobacteriota bacterium]|nr:hypothetical protein [Acidobacteriota bacterium]